MLLVRVDFCESDAFWLLCFVLEDVLDPHFFSTAPVVFLGYQATAVYLKKLTMRTCRWSERIGHDEFEAVLDMVLSKWLISLFVNSLPLRVLDILWRELMITGSLRTLFGWTVGLLDYAELKTCGFMDSAV